MNVEIHTLAWPATHVDMLKSHSDVCRHLGLEVGYSIEQTPHGQWMDNILANSAADVVGFLDIDCVPTNRRCCCLRSTEQVLCWHCPSQ